MNSVTDAAIAALGEGQGADWRLQPETHAHLLGPAAGPLERILLQPSLGAIMASFNAADAKASAAQSHYKRLAKTSAVASFLAVVIASALLLPRATVVPPVSLTLATFVQFALLAVSFMCSLWTGFARPFETWMRQRAQAETKRIELFDTVLAASEMAQPGELPLLPLQLEYVRRFQLDVQRAYYKRRGRQHLWVARRGVVLRALALLIIAIAVIPVLANLRGSGWIPQSLAPVFNRLPEPAELAQRVFLSLGLIGGALQGLLAAYALLGQDERNAARYADTSQNLEALAHGPLSEARAAAAAGTRGPVLTFVALLHQQISSEHREWVALRTIAPDLSLDRLKAMSLPRL